MIGELSQESRHLDLGCGGMPRNPFQAKNLYGVDLKLRPSVIGSEVTLVEANIVSAGIPFPDSFFDSVSAYDFLEHVPRVAENCAHGSFPFVQLMSEIHRVLKPGGRFLALTPVYPQEAAFSDPTHVNFITRETYKYFTEPNVWAKMYGFTGSFKLVKNKVVNIEVFSSTQSSTWKRILRVAMASLTPSKKVHLVWEFICLKSSNM